MPLKRSREETHLLSTRIGRITFLDEPNLLMYDGKVRENLDSLAPCRMDSLVFDGFNDQGAGEATCDNRRSN